MMELLNRRTSVALPLDFIHVTSDYGFRKDPVIASKTAFHNGIDLRCAKGSLVYAMMPGVIEKWYIANRATAITSSSTM